MGIQTRRAMVRSAGGSLSLTQAVLFVGVWFAAAFVGFGTPAFILLLIIGMFACGTSRKWEGQPSAYSVFNDGVRLTGTLSADQVDAQLRNGGTPSVSHAPAASSFMQTALRGWGGGSEYMPINIAKAQASTEEEVRHRRAAAADAAEARAKRLAANGPNTK